MSARCAECHESVDTHGGRCRSKAERQDPYRPVALAVLPGPALVEAAACQWCRWWNGSTHVAQCLHPVGGGPGLGTVCHRINPRGECPHFSPSWLTRWLRALRLGRAPAMVDPRVWDENEARPG